MNADPLRIISAEGKPEDSDRPSYQRHSRREEVQATMERKWKNDPEQFNPLRDWFGRIRLERTMTLIQAHGKLSDIRVVDLGCGAGIFSQRLADQGADVDAVDIASLALERVKSLQNAKIHPIQGYVPRTELKDEAYQGVVACEVIGYLLPAEQRLLFNEVARLVTAEGWVVVSTRLDIDSEDALERLAELAETELIVKEWRLGYHRLAIRILDFFEAPGRFVRGAKDEEYRKEAMRNRYSLSRSWYHFNSRPMAAFFWKPIAWITTPFARWLKQRSSWLILCEKLSETLWQQDGATEAILIGQRRPLADPVVPPADEIPVSRKEKRFVWE